MIDFLLNESGDLIIEESRRKLDSIYFTFSTKKEEPIRVSFYTEEGSSVESERNGIKVSFSNNRIEESHSPRIIEGKSAISQKLLMALKTEKGDLKNRRSFGSKLYKHKHKDLHDRQTLIEVKRDATEAIDSFLSGADVSVSPTISKEFSYEQCMHINVKHRKIDSVDYIL